jgi:hypothetical protein
MVFGEPLLYCSNSKGPFGDSIVSVPLARIRHRVGREDRESAHSAPGLRLNPTFSLANFPAASVDRKGLLTALAWGPVFVQPQGFCRVGVVLVTFEVAACYTRPCAILSLFGSERAGTALARQQSVARFSRSRRTN